MLAAVAPSVGRGDGDHVVGRPPVSAVEVRLVVGDAVVAVMPRRAGVVGDLEEGDASSPPVIAKVT